MAAQPLLLRDGNPTTIYKELYDTAGTTSLDLTPFAGQTVQLVFSNYNRHDNLFNTWSYVDDVRLLEWPLYAPTSASR